jgi:cytoskeletal protein RodZ
MTQHSNSSSSGFGSLLARGFLGIVSITATAVVSGVVQRYLTPPTDAPVPAVTSTSPTAKPNIAPGSASVSSPESPDLAAGDRPLDQNQPIDSAIQVETQPVADPSPVDQTPIDQTQIDQTQIDQAQAETVAPIPTQSATVQPSTQPDVGSLLRERLDEALRDKWNKN